MPSMIPEQTQYLMYMDSVIYSSDIWIGSDLGLFIFKKTLNRSCKSLLLWLLRCWAERTTSRWCLGEGWWSAFAKKRKLVSSIYTRVSYFTQSVQSQDKNVFTDSVKLIFQNTCKMEEGSFVDSKGRKLKTFTWTPSQTPRGLVFLSHG